MLSRSPPYVNGRSRNSREVATYEASAMICGDPLSARDDRGHSIVDAANAPGAVFVRDAYERAVVEQHVVLIAHERFACAGRSGPPAFVDPPWTGRVENRLRRRADESRRSADDAHDDRLRCDGT